MSAKSHIDDNGKVICAKIGKGGLSGISVTEDNTKAASEAFDRALGATGFYDYDYKNRKTGKSYTREGAIFPKNITKKLVLK